MKHEQFFVTFAAIGASIAVLAGAATAALAQQAPQATVVGERANVTDMTVKVSYSDLNLALAHDLKRLNSRVGRAAKVVCGPNETIIPSSPYVRCVSGAWDGARPQIALAVERARQIAALGSSNIPLVAIAVAGTR